ncbi:hypothetical protein GQ42DRAFT_153789 [Ramicandelaber brevisporus]|nr:hypothetical protein GQ42DRAFT_153789 [Ramicandelaber brevisporus]
MDALSPKVAATAGQQQQQQQQQDLWSVILGSVASPKSIAPKHLLLLGDPSAAKSQLIEQLKRASNSTQAFGGEQVGSSTGIPTLDIPSIGQQQQQQAAGAGNADLALSYRYIDAHDDENEDVLARIDVYSLASTISSLTGVSDNNSEPFLPLLRYPITGQTLADGLSCVLVVDFSNLWTVVAQIEYWVSILTEAINKVTNPAPSSQSPSVISPQLGNRNQSSNTLSASAAAAIFDSCREQIEQLWKSYQDHSAQSSTAAAVAASAVPTSSAVTTVDVPLPPGTLTQNLGISLVIVLANTEAYIAPPGGTASMIVGGPGGAGSAAGGLRNRQVGTRVDIRDEHVDFILQTVRTIAISLGAAVFAIPQRNPAANESTLKLWQYVVHRLMSFQPVAVTANEVDAKSPSLEPSADAASPLNKARDSGEIGGVIHSQRLGMYPYRHRAQVIDRSTLLIPAGWDSWGKIRATVTGFECQRIYTAWSGDITGESEGAGVRETALAITLANLPQPPPTLNVPSITQRYGGRHKQQQSQLQQSDKLDTQQNTIADETVADDDQQFLGKFYEVHLETHAINLSSAATSQRHKLSSPRPAISSEFGSSSGPSSATSSNLPPAIAAATSAATSAASSAAAAAMAPIAAATSAATSAASSAAAAAMARLQLPKRNNPSMSQQNGGIVSGSTGGSSGNSPQLASAPSFSSSSDGGNAALGSTSASASSSGAPASSATAAARNETLMNFFNTLKTRRQTPSPSAGADQTAGGASSSSTAATGAGGSARPTGTMDIQAQLARLQRANRANPAVAKPQ